MRARGLSSDAELAARLAAIVQASDDAIIGKTVDDVITAWNPAAERIFGFSAAEALGRPIALIIPDDRLAEEEELCARIARGEIVDRLETVRRAKDGRRIAVVLSVAPIQAPDGRVLGASAILRDVSERQRALEALRRSEAHASAFSRSRSRRTRATTSVGARARSAVARRRPAARRRNGSTQSPVVSVPSTSNPATTGRGAGLDAGTAGRGYTLVACRTAPRSSTTSTWASRREAPSGSSAAARS